MVQCSGVIRHFTHNTPLSTSYVSTLLPGCLPIFLQTGHWNCSTCCILHVFHLRVQAVHILVLHKCSSIDGHFSLWIPFLKWCCLCFISLLCQCKQANISWSQSWIIFFLGWQIEIYIQLYVQHLHTNSVHLIISTNVNPLITLMMCP